MPTAHDQAPGHWTFCPRTFQLSMISCMWVCFLLVLRFGIQKLLSPTLCFQYVLRFAFLAALAFLADMMSHCNSRLREG